MRKYASLCAVGLLFAISSAMSQSSSQALVGKNGWLFYSTEWNNPTPSAQINEAITGIKQISEELASHSIELYVAIVPIKARLYSDMLPDGFQLSTATMDQYSDILGQMNSEGINTIDLNTLFLDKHDHLDAAPLWWKTDTHWSTLGVLAAGEFIAGKITAENLLDDSSVVKYELSISSLRSYIESDGDLYGKLTNEQKLTYKDSFLIKDVDIERMGPKTDLLDNDIPDVVLVGTSYSALFGGLLAKAIAYNLNRDVLDVSEAAKFYFLPMYNYITSSVFEDNPPKVIVWELPERQLTALGGSYIKLTDPKFTTLIEHIKK